MTAYDNYLSQVKASCKVAYEYIPKMCNALRNENSYYSNEDIRDRVRKDCLEAGLAESTITHNIPEEFKDPIKVAAGKKSAGKKKIALKIATSGAAVTAAENNSESEFNPNLESFEVLRGKINKDENKWMSGDEDAEFLKKQLNKQIEENQQKDIVIDELQKVNLQLSEVVKKDSFTPATNYKTGMPKRFDFPKPDESNTFVWKNISFDEFKMKLGPLKARSNSKINVYLERVV